MLSKINKGFTLIELLVVIAVVGILASGLALVVNPLEQTKKSRDAQRKADLAQIQEALELYQIDNNHYPESIPFGSTWPSYIEVVPKEPLSTQPQYAYQSIEGGTGYRLYAKLERCSDSQIIDGINCDSEPYNYSVVSPNLVVRAYVVSDTPVSTPAPTATLTPTSTPTPPTPTSCSVSSVPSGYKYVFVTSQVYEGNLVEKANALGLSPIDGLDAADKICKYLADTSGSATAVKNKTWKAWLSTDTQSPSTRNFWQGEYRLVNGSIIANNWCDLTDGSINNVINVVETGVADTTAWGVASGTSRSGTSSPPNCLNWTHASNNEPIIKARYGITDRSGVEWTDYASSGHCKQGQDYSFRLYCFEQ